MTKLLIDYNQIIELLAADGCAPPCEPQTVLPWAVAVIKDLKEDNMRLREDVANLNLKIKKITKIIKE